jgi:SNF2 family DNA or RNA helicase
MTVQLYNLEPFNGYLTRNSMDSNDHQTDGINWCLRIEKEGEEIDGHKVTSGILADEMGLGKTIQMIGLMLCNFKSHNLIVLPRALLEQWYGIICRTLGHVPLLYHGSSARGVTKEQLSGAPVVVTTYGMLAGVTEKTFKGKPLKYGPLHDVVWDRIIFDEAHHLRNRNTRNHKAACHVRASHKWLVTGTPIQNGLTDLFGLCAVLGLSQPFYVRRDNMVKVASRLILKRTKEGVGIGLPPLKRTIVTVPWANEAEKQLAEDIHVHLQFSRLGNGREHNPFGNMGFHHFAMLQRARQSCIDMGLMKKNIEKLMSLELIDEDFPVDEAMGYHSKIDKVVEIISERKDNKRPKLVFSHYHMEIDRVVKSLSELGLKVGKFDGRVSQADRDEMLERGDLDALVLQIKTGCEGLNLQHFKEVYFVSPHWNPAVEDQAVARCHRIGQDVEVDVFSFKMAPFDEDRVTRTMDLYVKEVQRVKRNEMALVDGEPEGDGEQLEEPCAICLDKQHQHTHQKLECGHCFHKTCIGKWFERSAICPMCRQ